MIHLLFLIGGLGLVIAGQQLTLVVLKRLKPGGLKRWVQLLAIVMPVSLLILFSLTMLPEVLAPQTEHDTNADMHRDWLISLIGVTIFLIPVLFTLFLNLFRLGWLYVRTHRKTWRAPQGLENLLAGGSSEAQVRLWHSSHAFAFNLPRLWPGTKPRVIVSTGLVAELDEEELQAVLWHESAHLVQRDFWTVWLVSWWRLAFFYLPIGSRLLKVIKEDQELACDERVARMGGQPLALALAGALLKVWEQTLIPNKSFGFRAPGLASRHQDEVELTEQRVNRLLEWQNLEFGVRNSSTTQRRLRALGFLGGSVGLWMFLLELMHLMMLPFGCAISLNIF